MDAAARVATRRTVLERLGAGPDAVAEVLLYCESPFTSPRVPPPVFPLRDEPHLADWRRYASEAGPRIFEYLQDRLPQLAIPVREGVSKTRAWADVALRGRPFRDADFGGRLRLESATRLRLFVHEHPAGALPVMVTNDRGDFETLLRAMACRGEPRPIGPRVNAQLVSGVINWDRLARYRAEWTNNVSAEAAEGLWLAEMARVAAAEHWRFQDRFIIACAQPYSGQTALDLGLQLGEEEWLERSTRLRVEHEFTHYATKRVFNSMRRNLLDETIADFMGTTHALGTFRAAWYVRFLGLEAWPRVRPDGRIHSYASELSPPSFTVLCALVVKAAHSLELLFARFYSGAERGRFLLALAPLTLELLASDEAESLFTESYEVAGRLTAATV
jgi:uncharacterized protein DUF7005